MIFQRALRLCGDLTLGGDNYYHLLFGDINERMTKFLDGKLTLNMQMIHNDLNLLLQGIDYALNNENLKRYKGNRAFDREMNSLRYLKQRVTEAIADLNKPSPSFNWVH